MKAFRCIDGLKNVINIEGLATLPSLSFPESHSGAPREKHEMVLKGKENVSLSPRGQLSMVFQNEKDPSSLEEKSVIRSQLAGNLSLESKNAEFTNY